MTVICTYFRIRTIIGAYKALLQEERNKKFPMRIPVLFIFVSTIFFLTSCSGIKPGDLDTADAPVLELAATHAIETEFPVRDIAFVENTDFPWLSTLVHRAENGRLHSSDIEGIPVPQGNENFQSPVFTDTPLPPDIAERISKPVLSSARLEYGEDRYWIAVTAKDILLLDAGPAALIARIRVVDGLSITGLETAAMVAVTDIGFGGAAFADGFVVFADGNDNRLVFISRVYLEEKLAGFDKS